ncbi:MAG TPA: lytic transglycosylase domain-containing protein [Rhizomicrobium sp.]|nr:lytic transglycosylase domain-containing protein [Rhizomicrobium sp.]
MIGITLAGIAAYAASNLPNGLIQSGSVIMMPPIPDTGRDNGLLIDRERRPSPVHALSESDHDLYTRAFDAADRGDWVGARALAAQGHDAIAARLIQWRFVLDKNSGATFADIDGFLKNNPDWPLSDTLLARAEAALDPNTTPAAIIAWFGDRTPLTGLGMIRLGDAMIAAGHVDAGRKLVQRGWIVGDFQPDQELAIVRQDGAILTPDSDRARLSSLITRDEIAAARRELSRVDDETQKLGEARLALRTNRDAGEKLAARLAPALAWDPELLFDRARAARRAGDNIAAAALLERGALKDYPATHPSRWWPEANIVARELLQTGDYRRAYGLVSNSGLATGLEFSEAEFLAGWIALRYLKSPNVALAHFKKLEAGVSRPISLARARYWKARCYETSGDAASAVEQYKLAAEAPESFYGQIALARIDPSPTLHVNDMVVDATAVRADFDKDELVRAMRVLADLGQVNILRIFALREQELHSDAAHAKILAQTMVDLGFREIAVRIAKNASYAGTTMLEFTHPVIALPPYPASPAPDPAHILGLIRQETEFDPDAVSRSGARGLMQLMPASARTDANRAGLAWRPNDLTADPNYNIELGMAEFQGYVADWNGSLVLAIASYNAGRNNVKKWVAANGDPRLPATDPINWIESIPFGETRNYVQRVLENAQIYRNRLSGRDQPLRILQDLYAPAAPAVKPLSAFPP